MISFTYLFYLFFNENKKIYYQFYWFLNEKSMLF